jgi:hypothetical protein
MNDKGLPNVGISRLGSAFCFGVGLLITLAQTASSQHLTITHGGSLGTGPNWQGFPSRLVPNVAGSTSSSGI